MRRRLHLILGTDAPVHDLLRLGMGPWLRTMLAAYGRAFDVEVYSIDKEDFSSMLAAVHHPLGTGLRLPKAIRQILYHARLVSRARRMSGVVRALSPNIPVLREIARLSGSATIVDYHYDWASTAKTHYGGTKGLLAAPVQRRCVGAADLIIATTRDLARDVEKRYGKRAITIPNFVDTDLFRPREPRSETILFAGRLHWAKGVSVLIDAFTRIASSHPHAELILFGSGEQDDELRRQTPDSLRERIRFLGSRPQEDVARELGSAAVCALPTLTTEGNPKAVLEAMACGTPLVCSVVAGIADLVDADRTGLLVPPGDAGALAGAIARLLDDRELWQQISQAGLGRALQFGKERILRHQIRVMEICAARDGRDRPLLATSARIAAVIVAYGAHEPLERCIQSVARQVDAEVASIVVVDNNPYELRCDAARLCHAAGKAIQLDVVRPGSNVGYGRAVNFVLDRLQEDLVFISNPDLILDPDLLALLGEALQARPNAAAAGPCLVALDGATPAPIPARPPRLGNEIAGLAGLDRLFRRKRRGSLDSVAIAPVDFLSGACFLARREALADARGFDPRFFLYYEDADLFLRLRASGRELLLVPAAVARHTHGGTWSDPVRRQAAAFQGARLYYRKHGGRAAEIAYRAGLLFLYAPRLLLGGFVLGLLGRESVFTIRDRFRMLGRTAELAFSPADVPGGGSPNSNTRSEDGHEPPTSRRGQSSRHRGAGGCT